jgi:hypothetical protein
MANGEAGTANARNRDTAKPPSIGKLKLTDAPLPKTLKQDVPGELHQCSGHVVIWLHRMSQ